MGDSHGRLSKQQHTAPSHDRLYNAFAKPSAVAVDPSGECGDDRLPGNDVSVKALERGVRQRPQAEGSGGVSSVMGRGPVAP